MVYIKLYLPEYSKYSYGSWISPDLILNAWCVSWHYLQCTKKNSTTFWCHFGLFFEWNFCVLFFFFLVLLLAAIVVAQVAEVYASLNVFGSPKLPFIASLACRHGWQLLIMKQRSSASKNMERKTSNFLCSIFLTSFVLSFYDHFS